MNIHEPWEVVWAILFLAVWGLVSIFSNVPRTGAGFRATGSWIADRWLWVFGDTRKEIARIGEGMDKGPPSDEDDDPTLYPDLSHWPKISEH